MGVHVQVGVSVAVRVTVRVAVGGTGVSVGVPVRRAVWVGAVVEVLSGRGVAATVGPLLVGWTVEADVLVGAGEVVVPAPVVGEGLGVSCPGAGVTEASGWAGTVGVEAVEGVTLGGSVVAAGMPGEGVSRGSGVAVASSDRAVLIRSIPTTGILYA